MKKPNRIARKGDTARSRAQGKRRASAPAKSTANAARKRPAAKPPKPKPSPEAAFAAAIGLENNPHGEYLCDVERADGADQILYQKDGKYVLVTLRSEVRAGRGWQSWDRWSERNPGIAPWSIHGQHIRRRESSAITLTRTEVVAWLDENRGSVVIPPDFVEEFRPFGIAWNSNADDARKGFYALAGLALKHCGDGEELVGTAISLMHVANALGLKEEAALAAKIINCHNAATTASYGLTGHIETELAGKL